MAENEERKGLALCGGIVGLVFAGLGYMLLYETVKEMVRPGSKSDGVVGKCVYIAVIIIIGGCLLVYTALVLSMLFFGALDFWKTLTSLPKLAETAKIQPIHGLEPSN
ncbi:hypothetical protein FNV43_RR18550 [Rhamnella rubrinervis]|uniref:Uncharacterized protein n=1 Tax=Rhamnella rubrinervis TaxID=2594499 RepID=A0A8K0E4S2_9ROSA|nr:hypothetical protein FNV43_RR18550 [Rhamnella rubrinervis]